jgi:DNA-binding YbaB/EbfC family protein
MQANMQRAQAELAVTEVEGQASNGLIKIKMTCKNEIKKIDIDPSLLEDKEMLEDMMVVALKDTFKQIEEVTNAKMSGLVPPGMNLPF